MKSFVSRPFGCALLTAASLIGAAGCGGETIDVPDKFFTCTEIQGIALGGTRGGTLSDADCNDPSYTAINADYWYFTLDTTTSVRIDVSSTEFDPYLKLYRVTTMGLIDSDDDSGLNLDAQTTQTLASGEYVVVATAVSSSDDTGAYQVSVRKAP